MANASTRIDTSALPSLPYISHEILLAVNADEPDPAALHRTLARDPALAARIVSTANSAFFAGHGTATGVMDAVRRLGVNRLRVLATSILLRNQFDADRCPGFEPGRYWQHAIATANAAGRLARTAEIDPGPAQLGGLLHSIGVLLLAHNFPAEMDDAFRERAAAPDAALAPLIRVRLDADHHQAGALLLREWELPPALCAMVEGMGSPGAAREPGLLGLLRGAADWADAGFETLPAGLTDRGLGDEALEAVARACRREHEETVALARLLAA